MRDKALTFMKYTFGSVDDKIAAQVADIRNGFDAVGKGEAIDTVTAAVETAAKARRDELIESGIKIIVDNLDEATIDAVNAFHESAAYQNLLTAAPKIAEAWEKASTAWMQSVMSEVEPVMTKAFGTPEPAEAPVTDEPLTAA